MLPRIAPRVYAALAAILFAGQVQAGTIYQYFQGGTGGVLEMQFTVDNPNVLPGQQPFLGTFQVVPTLAFPTGPLSCFTYGSIGAVGNLTNDEYLTVQAFGDITQPGTYALGQPDSFIRLAQNIHIPGALIPLDTLVVSLTDPVDTPEPGTFTLLGMGMALLGIVCIRRRAKAHSGQETR